MVAVIRVDLAQDVPGQVRFAISPLWEVVASLGILVRGDAACVPYGAWVRHGRQAISRGPAAPLVTWFDGLTRRSAAVPAPLTPIPPCPEPTIDEELEALASASLPGVANLPDGGVDWFVEAVAAYWRAAVRPYWTVMRAVLQEDLLHRAHLFITGGVEKLLAEADYDAWGADGSVTISGALRTEPAGPARQLVIVPLLFWEGTRRCVPDGDGSVAVSCQARGAALFGDRHSVPAGAGPQVRDRLAILVGRRRAALMRALTEPRSTSAIAAALGLSPSTVSEHLALLLAAGVVRRRRAGARVLYELDQAGVAILGHLDQEPL